MDRFAIVLGFFQNRNATSKAAFELFIKNNTGLVLFQVGLLNRCFTP
jgi:hypothetical protein